MQTGSVSKIWQDIKICTTCLDVSLPLRLWIECIIVRPCTGAIQALTFSLYILKAGPYSNTPFQQPLCSFSMILPLFGTDCSGPLGAGNLCTRLLVPPSLYIYQCWNFRTVYEGQELSRNRVVVPARQATQAGGIDSLESIPGLL